MDTKASKAGWQLSISRKTRCTLCKRSLHVQCAICEAGAPNKSCWVNIYKDLGPCHEHCRNKFRHRK